ncbi:MAG TPA: hypothetical protein VFQ91_22940 [Bryobacteraceae bacterium]|nr:hypothetical protein [Bryobacteraceae bacterium]
MRGASAEMKVSNHFVPLPVNLAVDAVGERQPFPIEADADVVRGRAEPHRPVRRVHLPEAYVMALGHGVERFLKDQIRQPALVTQRRYRRRGVGFQGRKGAVTARERARVERVCRHPARAQKRLGHVVFAAADGDVDNISRQRAIGLGHLYRRRHQPRGEVIRQRSLVAGLRVFVQIARRADQHLRSGRNINLRFRQSQHGEPRGNNSPADQRVRRNARVDHPPRARNAGRRTGQQRGRRPHPQAAQ